MSNDLLVLLVDRKHGRFLRYDTATERLEELEMLSSDTPRPTRGASWAGLADDKIARHIDVHVRRHFEMVLDRLIHELRHSDGEPAQVLLGGPEEVVTEFLALVPNDLKDRVIGTIHPKHFAGVKELEGQVQQAITSAKHQSVQTLIDEIEGERKPGGRGVVGQEPVFEVLNLKQVQTLLLCDDKTYPGRRCPKDGALVKSMKQCPLCMGPMESSEDLRSAMRVRAEEQDAAIVVVADPKLLPDEAEGLAALKRFGG